MTLAHLECARCNRTYSAAELHGRCDCGSTLLARYDLADVSFDTMRARPPSPWRYRELLPLAGEPVSLGESETPLVACHRLSEHLGIETFIKDDGPLPSLTFKARGAQIGLSRALELGVRSVVLPSAGNAGGAWSLYAARAGVPITVTMARSAPAMNFDEVRLAGGNLVLVDGSIADAGARAKAIAAETGAFNASTFSEPYRVEGKKTAWLEVFDALGDGSKMRMPGTVITPVGGGVAAVALAKAAEEVAAAGLAPASPPRIVGVQPSDCAPIVAAFEAGAEEVAPWPSGGASVAAGLRVPAPSEGWLVLRCVRASGGSMHAVDEAGIVNAIGTIASMEGVLCCPEGAATLVAAERLAERDELVEPLVLYNTGAGHKYLGMLPPPA